MNASFGRWLSRASAGLDDVVRSLPADTALVAYVRFMKFVRAPGTYPVAMYAALTLDGPAGRPRLVALGPASDIEPAVERWRREAGTDPRAGDAAERERIYRNAAGRLRSLIWDPVAAALRSSRRAIVVPDGAISLVSIGALAGSDGYLVESEPTLHYLGAERDLVQDSPRAVAGNDLVIVGGPDFDAAPAGRMTAHAGASAAARGNQAAPAALRGPRAACAEFRALRFEPLPRARAEADEVATLWSSFGKVRKLTGSQADEVTFKSMAAGASVLHLSTHAFFMAGACDAAKDPIPTASVTGTDFENYAANRPEDALLFSGLALAGANHSQEGAAREETEDGILTAEEISALDLSAASWVVLSACETGLGKVLSGEGVLGLRRAFETAGAGTLVMSLWQVEDDATRAWMTGLYRSRLAGSTTADAVRQASLDLLRSRRGRGVSTHPFFWGGFVASGDWR